MARWRQLSAFLATPILGVVAGACGSSRGPSVSPPLTTVATPAGRVRSHHPHKHDRANGVVFLRPGRKCGGHPGPRTGSGPIPPRRAAHQLRIDIRRMVRRRHGEELAAPQHHVPHHGVLHVGAGDRSGLRHDLGASGGRPVQALVGSGNVRGTDAGAVRAPGCRDQLIAPSSARLKFLRTLFHLQTCFPSLRPGGRLSGE